MQEKPKKLQRRLTNRHLQMIALGGAIGTGLFYGSASTIALTGPSVMLSYLLGGIIIFFIMRMLGEMAVDEPVSGSFSYYASKYWGAFPSFLSGWNYWFNYVIVSMAELTAVGIHMHFWFPDLPQWVSALICLIVITTINLFNVRVYGEMEFWLAAIKVVAILGMIILGAWLIFNQPLPFPDKFQNLWVNGGFFPYGAWGFALSIVIVMFSFGGVELIGITAGETEAPERTIPQAIHQVIWRILIFYVGTMLVLMTLWPWNQVGAESSPFVQIFSQVGIPAAAHILNIVVLSAAVSVYNSAIYSNARMLYGLAQAGNAPKVFLNLSARGVPLMGILVSSGSTLIVVVLNYFLPEQAFMIFLSIATAAAVVSWLTITITHMKFRAWCEKHQHITKFRSMWFPVANYICIVFLIGIYVFMYQLPDTQLAVILLPVWLLILWAGYQVRGKQESKKIE